MVKNHLLKAIRSKNPQIKNANFCLKFSPNRKTLDLRLFDTKKNQYSDPNGGAFNGHESHGKKPVKNHQPIQIQVSHSKKFFGLPSLKLT